MLPVGASYEGSRFRASSLEGRAVKVNVPVVLGAALLLTVGSATALRGQTPTAFIVESPTMTTGRFMPRDYSPDGRNVSPPLRWSGLPEGTRQLAVISQDYGAGRPPPWVHWIIYNIPGPVLCCGPAAFCQRRIKACRFAARENRS